MTSYEYNTYKFEYYSDDVDIYVKYQREYLDKSGLPLTPLTATFFTAVVDDSNKIDKTSKDMRHMIAYVRNFEVEKGYSEIKTYLPYAYDDTRLEQHVEEILSVDRVICADYKGESANYKELVDE